MPSFLLIVLLLWVVTAVHEAGHALAVRLKGGRVLAFEVGRGPALRGTSAGGTRMALGLLPVGGRIVYRGVPTGTGHAVVAMAGPAANLLFAVILLRSTRWAGEWLWLVPGSVVELLAEGRAFGLLHGMRIVGSALSSGVPAEVAFALGALSAVWAGLNLLPIPGIGSDGWAVLSGIVAAMRGKRGTTGRAPDSPGERASGQAIDPGAELASGADPNPGGARDSPDRREVS